MFPKRLIQECSEHILSEKPQTGNNPIVHQQMTDKQIMGISE